MKKLIPLAAAIALATAATTGAMAGEKIKPLKVTKSTQAVPPPTSLGLGGLGAGATGALVAGVVVTTIVVVANSTSGT